MNTVVSQALATGLPVVTTRHSGLPEQVIDGKNGFVVAEGDYRSLAERVLQLARSPRLLRSFGEAGRRHVKINYDATALIDRQIDLYAQLVCTSAHARLGPPRR